MKHTYQVCISGSAKGGSVREAARLATEVARATVAGGHTVLTGATTGLPYEAAKAAKKAGGVSIGFSPAANRRDHIKSYRLPIDAFTTIIFTNFGYMGRDLLMVRSCDALIMVGGRLGTLNEFATAVEEHKVVGVLLGSGGMTSEVEHVLKAAHRVRSNIIFGHDPEHLVHRLLQLLNHKYRKLN